MNCQDIADQVVAIFPNLEIRNTELETQRVKILRDFYYGLLFEFGVDVDNITKVGF